VEVELIAKAEESQKFNWTFLPSGYIDVKEDN
jgi:hypothetical protein